MRLPVVLCDLEGLTYEQAARASAGPSRRSVAGWSKARERLRARSSVAA